MIRSIAMLVLLISLAGCSAHYKPQEWPLRSGLIPESDIRGSISVNNAQSSKDEAVVYSYMGSTLLSDYNTITSVMVEQAKKELSKNFNVSESDAKKNMDISVHYLLSTYQIMYWTSEIRFTAKLGNGKEISKTVTHASGELQQDLNGCIAEAVIYLLNDPEVRAYLAE